MTRRLAFAALALLAAAPVRAGIADSPLPVLDPSAKTLHLYSVPGVLHGSNSQMRSQFVCTSTSTSSQVVGVELFPGTGGGPLNDATTTALTVPPGGTVRFGTGNFLDCAVFETSNGTTYSPLGVAPNINALSARIIGTSKSLICTAFAFDCTSNPPQAGWPLTVVAKTKQKGD